MYAVICRQSAVLRGRAEPNLTGAGRAGPTAPHRTGPLFAVAPASYDTHFEREGKCGLKVCVCCHGPGAEEERLSALYWNLMYAVDAYGLQICKQDQYDTLKEKVTTLSAASFHVHPTKPHNHCLDHWKQLCPAWGL